MNSAGQLVQYVSPVTDVVGADGTIRVLARAADQMDGRSKRACPSPASFVGISVSTGHEPVTIQPASTTAIQNGFPTRGCLTAKTTRPIPSGRSMRRPSPNALVIILS